MPPSGSIRIGDKWTQVSEKFAEKGGVLVTLGAPDTGKSTFNFWLCRELDKMGKTTAVVDCDMGQSDIGPPSALGMAIIKPGIEKFSDLQPDGIWFAGSVKPSGHFLQGLAGVTKLTGKAKAMGATHIVVNTTGWIDGPGIFYKQQKIDAVLPSFIVGFQYERELLHVVSAYRRYDGVSTIFIEPSPSVCKRKSDERRIYRDEKFRQYFSDASMIALSTAKTGISGYGFFPDETRLANQIVALINSEGEHKALGIVRKFNSKNRIIEIEAKLTDNPSAIRRIHFENFRINEEGNDYSGKD
ncbi:MAG: polynucleotide 5'-hydroxyl-kinase [Firmicutes bacterium]|nr:polynucleotide 5'-hydroxyl-kinase [Bacillota bacterium]